MRPNQEILRKRAALNVTVLIALLFMFLGVPSPALAATPSNDSFANAITILSAPTTLTINEVDFNDATEGFGDPDVCGYGNPGVHTVWYSFTPSGYGNATINTYGSGFDTILAVWTGSFGNLQEVACADDTNGLQSQVNLPLKPGVHYYIEVIQFTSSTAPEKESGAADSLAVTDYMTLNLEFTLTPNIAAPGKYDDKSSFLTYTGTWLNTNSSLAYSASFKASKVVGNTASITFDGYQFKIYYTRGLSYGVLQIFLDGGTTEFARINQSGTTAYQQVWTSPTLTDGIHTIQLRDAYRYVSIDAIEIVTAPDVVPPAQITDLAAAPGASYGAINLSWTSVGDDGMTGSATSYDLRYSKTPIVDTTTFNAATQITSGLPTPKPAGQAETMTLKMTPGLTYYFAVRALDDPAPDPTPSLISNSASATASFVGSVGAGTYSNEHANWMYSGTWALTTGLGALDLNYRASSTIGNSAAFVFNGKGFTFTYLLNNTGGVAQVYVDGVAVKQISMKYLATRWKQSYTLSGLTSGQHTVQIVHLSGAKVYVDGITITP